ncbi:MAG: NAD(P)-binding domain-containing protein [Pseudomonadota bacterium]
MIEPVVIIGGGVAGAAAAIHLARADVPVVLLERTVGAHVKVCGEFLSNVSLRELSALGIDVARLGAVPVNEVRIDGRTPGRPIELPFSAASLTRERLDQALLAVAEDAGVEVRRGMPARGIAPTGHSWSVETSRGLLRASDVVVATGKLDLRGMPRHAPRLHPLVGLKRYGAAQDGKRVTLALFPHGYCGLQPIEDGRTNVCLVVTADRLRALGGRPEKVFEEIVRRSPHLEPCIGTADDPVVAVGRVPYGFVRRSTNGAYFVGDQAAVIPSYCGEGIGIALSSGRSVAAAIAEGVSAQAFQADFARRVAPRVRNAKLVSRALCTRVGRGAAQLVAGAMPAVVRKMAVATRTPRATSA